jgi:hypothetical protein
MISDRISGKVFFTVFYLQVIRLMTGKLSSTSCDER